MTVKEFDKLKIEDFQNGAILDEIRIELKKAEKTQQELKTVKRWLHFFMDDVKPELKEMLTKAILSDIQHPDPAIEKARLWDKVKECADSRPPCKCPLWKEDACTLEYGGCIFRDVVEALEGGQDENNQG